MRLFKNALAFLASRLKNYGFPVTLMVPMKPYVGGGEGGRGGEEGRVVILMRTYPIQSY